MLFAGHPSGGQMPVRLMAAMASLAVVLLLMLYQAHSVQTAHARRSKLYASEFWERTVPAMSDEEFRGYFRLSRPRFEYVASRIAAHPTFAKYNNRKMPVEKCLALALMRMAFNMPYKLLCHSFGVCEGSIRNATVRTMSAIRDTLMYEYVTSKFPRTAAEYTAACRMMARVGKAVFPNCIGAIDVTHVPVCAANWGPGLTKENFIDRTGKISSLSHQVSALAPVFVVGNATARRPASAHTHARVSPLCSQCVVNGNLQFIDVEAGFSGRAHDMGIFKGTVLGIYGHEVIWSGYYLLADSGYAHRNFMLRPFDTTPDMPATAEKTNYLISSSRMVVERAFGVLKHRFRALLTGITVYDVNEAATWFVVAVILHNICREYPDDRLPELMPCEVFPMPEERPLPGDSEAPEIRAESAVVPPAPPHHALFDRFCHIPVGAERAEHIRNMDGFEFSEYVHRDLGYIEKSDILQGRAQRGDDVNTARGNAAVIRGARGSSAGAARRRRAGSITSSSFTQTGSEWEPE